MTPIPGSSYRGENMAESTQGADTSPQRTSAAGPARKSPKGVAKRSAERPPQFRSLGKAKRTPTSLKRAGPSQDQRIRMPTAQMVAHLSGHRPTLPSPAISPSTARDNPTRSPHPLDSSINRDYPASGEPDVDYYLNNVIADIQPQPDDPRRDPDYKPEAKSESSDGQQKKRKQTLSKPSTPKTPQKKLKFSGTEENPIDCDLPDRPVSSVQETSDGDEDTPLIPRSASKKIPSPQRSPTVQAQADSVNQFLDEDFGLLLKTSSPMGARGVSATPTICAETLVSPCKGNKHALRFLLHSVLESPTSTNINAMIKDLRFSLDTDSVHMRRDCAGTFNRCEHLFRLWLETLENIENFKVQKNFSGSSWEEWSEHCESQCPSPDDRWIAMGTEAKLKTWLKEVLKDNRQAAPELLENICVEVSPLLYELADIPSYVSVNILTSKMRMFNRSLAPWFRFE